MTHCKVDRSPVKYTWFQWNAQSNMQMITCVLFPAAHSTEAARMSTWRKISFCPIHRALALKPSLTCERWAHGFVCPPESTSLSLPPSSPTKRLTLSSESSLRSNQKQSMCGLHFILMSVCGSAQILNVMLIYIFFLLQRNGWWNLCWFRRWRTCQTCWTLEKFVS